MSNKNVSQYSLLTNPNIDTGDYLYLWDTSAGLSYKVYVNDIASIVPSINNPENHFTDILVDRYAWISGIIGGQTGQNLLSGKYPGILGGQTNRAVANNASVLGGASNLASGVDSSVCGNGNQVQGNRSVSFGGINNILLGPGDSAILGGDTNTMLYGDGNVILGGITNVITGITSYSIIMAGQSNRLMALRSAIIAGLTNKVSGNDAVTVGGSSNLASGLRSTVIGGTNNQSFGQNATILGSNGSKTLGNNAIVLGGATNLSSGLDSVTAGDSNTAYGTDSFIAGGTSSIAYGNDSFIAAGTTNYAWGNSSSVLGGNNNVASGYFSAALGQSCEAFPNGAHMFGDSTNVVKRAYGPDSLTLNYSGGCWITGGGLNARRGFNLYPTGVTPTASTPGRSGDFAYKDNFLYVFTGDQTDLSNKNWGRIQLSTLNSTPPSVVPNDSSIVYFGPQTTNAGNARGQFVLGFDPGNTDPYTAIVFDNNSPIITLPAGNGTYMIDAIFGIYRGSVSNNFTIKLRNTTDNADVANSQVNYVFPGAATTELWYTMKNFITVTASKTIQLYGAYSGADDLAAGLGMMPSGGRMSYVKLA